MDATIANANKQLDKLLKNIINFEYSEFIGSVPFVRIYTWHKNGYSQTKLQHYNLVIGNIGGKYNNDYKLAHDLLTTKNVKKYTPIYLNDYTTYANILNSIHNILDPTFTY